MENDLDASRNPVMGMPVEPPEPEIVANNEILRDNLGIGRDNRRDADNDRSRDRDGVPSLRAGDDRRPRELGIAIP